MRTPALKANTHNRAGYTLAEVLIASVLVASLMVVCWNLMGLYSGFMTAGREKVLERQIARSLFEIIRDDVRVVAAPTTAGPPPQALPATAPSLPPSQTTTAPAVQPTTAPSVQPTIAPTPVAVEPAGSGTRSNFEPVEPFEPVQSFESFEPSEFDNSGTSSNSAFAADVTTMLVGTSTSLSLTYLVDPPGAADAVTGDQLEGSFDIADDSTQASASANTIVYHFEPPAQQLATETALPFGLHRVEASAFAYQEAIAAQQLVRGEQSDSESEPRSSGPLSRLTFDALFQPVDAVTEGLDEIAGPVFEPTHEHVPEAVRAEFEYYDGRNWASNWNTQRRRSLPVAIRVTLWIVSAAELETASEVLSAEVSASAVSADVELPNIRPRRYRRVISLSPQAQLDTGSIPDEFATEVGP